MSIRWRRLRVSFWSSLSVGASVAGSAFRRQASGLPHSLPEKPFAEADGAFTGIFRPIKEADIWRNVGDNLGRAGVAETATQFLKTGTDIRRGSVIAIPAAHVQAESQQRNGRDEMAHRSRQGHRQQQQHSHRQSHGMAWHGMAWSADSYSAEWQRKANGRPRMLLSFVTVIASLEEISASVGSRPSRLLMFETHAVMVAARREPCRRFANGL
jgi:hypothetical protein